MAKYIEVRRKAEVGERIRMVVDGECGDFKTGDEFRVEDVESGGIALFYDNVHDMRSRGSADYVVLEDVAEAVASLADTATESPAQSLVIVRPDPSLNGIQREYTQEKRRASVGDTVMHTYRGDSSGLVAVVEYVESNGDVTFDGVEYPEGGDTAVGFTADGYVVLTATDVIHVNRERFRMVERKAAVGERIIITNPDADASVHGGYHKGIVGNVRKVDEYYSEEDAVCITDMDYYLHAHEYAVLEPITEPSANPSAPTSQEDAVEAPKSVLDVVTSLTVNLARLQREFADYKAETDAQFTEIAAQLESKKCGGSCGCADGSYVKVASGSVTDRIPSFITRDDVVQRAIVDVAKLSVSRADNVPVIGGGRAVFRMGDESFLDSVRFEVNSAKRAVVALLLTHDGHVWARGIAKCAPGDVFNVHIGKAIALRRALALPVPQEYVKCPQSAEGDVRVGDIVANWKGRAMAVADNPRLGTNQLSLGYVKGRGYKVIDDSARYGPEVLA